MNLFSPYAKTYVALAGSTATALLAVFTAETTVGKVLTVIAVVATAYGTFQTPNTPVVKAGPTDPKTETVLVEGSTAEEVEDALAPEPEVSGNLPYGDPEAGPYNPDLNMAYPPHDGSLADPLPTERPPLEVDPRLDPTNEHPYDKDR